MLTLMRSPRFRWVLMLCVILIVLGLIMTFGAFGGSDLGRGAPYAAKVNGVSVPQKAFEDNYQQRFRLMSQFQNYSREDAKRDGLAEKVMDTLVEQELFAQEAKAQNLGVSKQEVRKYIEERIFDEGESFTPELYRERLSNLNTTPALFEKRVKRDLLAQAFIKSVRDNINVSDAAVKTQYMNDNTWVKLEYIKLDPASANIEELNNDAVKGWLTKNEDAVKAHYDEHINLYRGDQELQFDYINLPYSAENKSGVESEITKLRDQVIAGEAFDKVKPAASIAFEGAPNADVFTELGKLPALVGREVMKQKKNNVSDIVDLGSSLAIFYKTDQKPGAVKALADVKTEIAKSLATREAQMASMRASAQTVLASVKSGTKLEEINIPGFRGALTFDSSKAKENISDPELGLSGEVKKGEGYIPGIGFSSELTDAALLAKAGDTLNEVFEIGDRFFIARVTERQDADMSKFADAEDSIRNSLKAKRAFVAQSSVAKHLRENAKVSVNPDLTTANLY